MPRAPQSVDLNLPIPASVRLWFAWLAIALCVAMLLWELYRWLSRKE